MHNTNRELLRKYRRELQLRKKCHNELVRLKGVWRVAGPITGEYVPGGGQEGQGSITLLHPSTMTWVLRIPMRCLGW